LCLTSRHLLTNDSVLDIKNYIFSHFICNIYLIKKNQKKKKSFKIIQKIYEIYSF